MYFTCVCAAYAIEFYVATFLRPNQIMAFSGEMEAIRNHYVN